MDKLKPKLNCNLIADSPLGVKHTKQSRLNISNAQKGKSMKEKGHKKNCKCSVCNYVKRKNHHFYSKQRSKIVIQKIEYGIKRLL